VLERLSCAAFDLRVLLPLEQTFGVQASLLPHFVGLRRLSLHVGYIDDKGFKIAKYTLAPIIEGVCVPVTCNLVLKASCRLARRKLCIMGRCYTY
jgi:hypothetical protein